MTEKKNVTISIELLNTITGYLGTKPFQEIYPLINKIQEEAQQSFNVMTETEEEKE